MLDYRLDKHELAELRAAHRTARGVREAYRMSLILLGKERAPADVADALLIDPNTARDYFKRYKKSGLDGLLRMIYIGSEALLDDTQLLELDDHLQSHLYLTAEQPVGLSDRRHRLRLLDGLLLQKREGFRLETQFSAVFP